MDATPEETTLVIGNKNYSSWSLRAWLAMVQTGEPFREVLVPLYRSDSAQEAKRWSPSGLVPVLHHGGNVVWDSLAIAEYLAERFPAAGLWPQDPDARALARSVTAEMHSGFAALRAALSVDMRKRTQTAAVAEAAVQADIDRVCGLWRQCRERHGEGEGPFLFGGFGIPDAFYAPVVSRFRTYGVELEGECREYADAVWRHPPVQRWYEAACQEEWVIHEA